MNTLLVLTLGQTDVQVVIGDVRHELRKDHCAALHDEIKGRRWRIVDAPDHKADPPVQTLPTGELLLCTPKLDAVLREIVPTAALLLETCRDATSAPGDPRFAGVVLEKRLKDRGVKNVRREAYLQGAERLENRDEPRDAVIRREVVQRFEEAVRDAIKKAKPSRIVVVATGGFPVVGDLVEEIVRLHASVPVDAFEVADGAKANPPIADRAVSRTTVPEPRISFQARRRVLDLISKGNLLGAWAVAEQLHADEVERRWTRIIEWLACFASSLPIPHDCDIQVLKHHRMAVRAALRVDLALRAGDIPRAVHGTVAFWEAALWDHLLEHFEPTGQKRKGRDVLRLRNGKREPKGPKLLRDDQPCEEERRNCPFERSDDDTYVFYEDGAGRFAKCYVGSEQLKRLTDSITKIKDLRNDVAHNEPTPELMRDARSRMTEAGLWSSDGRFLTQEIIREVLMDLGESEPECICGNLVATVRSRLLEHRLDGGPS